MTDLLADRGDHETFHLTISTPDVNDVLQPVDLTGSKVWWAVRGGPKLSDPKIIEKDSEANGITIDPDQVTNRGKADIALVPADTFDLDETLLNKNLPWEVQTRDPSGNIATVARGKIKIRADIIRETT